MYLNITYKCNIIVYITINLKIVFAIKQLYKTNEN